MVLGLVVPMVRHIGSSYGGKEEAHCGRAQGPQGGSQRRSPSLESVSPQGAVGSRGAQPQALALPSRQVAGGVRAVDLRCAVYVW